MVDCPLCGTWHDSGDAMRIHLVTEHLDKPDPLTDWYCCWCGAYLVTRFGMAERTQHTHARLLEHFANNPDIVQHYLAYALGEQPSDALPF